MAFIKYPKGTLLSDGSVADGNTEYNSDIIKQAGSAPAQSSAPANNQPSNTGGSSGSSFGVSSSFSIDVGRGTPYTFDKNLLNAMIYGINSGQMTIDQAASALIMGASGQNADALKMKNPLNEIKDFLRAGGASKASAPTFVGGSPQNNAQPVATPNNNTYVAVTTPIATGSTSSYTGPSIIDYLNSVGKPSDYASRSQLAQQMGIQNYTGSAAQNSQMLNTLRTQEGGYKETKTYYTYDASGKLTPVSDVNTLKQLQSGQLAVKSYSSIFEVPLPSNSEPTETETQFYESPAYQNATDGQKEAIDQIIQAISTNDTEKAALLKKAFEKATADADPIFKQEIKMALDSLSRGFTAENEDLTFQETKLNNTLSDLRKDIGDAKGKLTLDEEAELKALQRDYEQKLETTVNDMAAAGFTNSSRRTKAEAILAETKGDMVESTRREFAAKSTALTDQGNRADRDTLAQIEYLRKLSERNKTTLGRNIEKEVGTSNLPSTPGYTPLGGLTGEAERRKQTDIDRAAMDYYSMGFVY